jgi:hypothetical protein
VKLYRDLGSSQFDPKIFSHQDCPGHMRNLGSFCIAQKEKRKEIKFP